MLLVRTAVGPCEHGLGLFAAEDIAAGTEVWRDDPSTVVRLTGAQVGALRASHGGGGAMSAFLAHFGYRLTAAGGCTCLELDDTRFVNHAPPERANLANRRGADGAGVMVAARDIRAGEELLEDYLDEYDAVECAAFLAPRLARVP